MTSRDLQPVGRQAGGAWSLHIRPKGGNHLGTDTLELAQHPVSQSKPSLDAQDVLVKSLGGIGGNLCALRPPTFTVSLDGLDGGLRLPREEVCKDAKK